MKRILNRQSTCSASFGGFFVLASSSPQVETESELGELASVLNEAFDRVESSFEQQRQFAADASHELRTPLAVIQSQIELALRKERGSEEYIKTLKTCSSASEWLSELVDSLLTLARLESGEQQTDRSPVRLKLVAAKCIDLVRPIAEQAELQLDSVTSPVTILGDRRQLEKARSRQRGGSGLGLPIAEQIVKAHGGLLSISSTLDEGTTVKLRFRSPAAQAGKSNSKM